MNMNLEREGVCRTEELLEKEDVCRTEDALEKEYACRTEDVSENVCGAEVVSEKDNACGAEVALKKENVCGAEDAVEKEDAYLTDDELEKLIADVEQNELVAVPPDMVDIILGNLDGSQEIGGAEITEIFPAEVKQTSDKPPEKSKLMRTSYNREFRRYCIRVMTSVAAAIAIMFVIPALWNPHTLEVPNKDEVVMQSDYLSKQEMMAQQKVVSKKEAMNQKGLLAQTLGGTNIFGGQNSLDIFSILNGDNGGL